MKRLQWVVAISAGLCASAVAYAGDSAEVTPAVRHDTLHSLRGVMPRPDDFSRSPVSHPARPLPWLDGPGNPQDGALQSSADYSVAAPTLGGSVDGVGQGFSGPQGIFSVQYAPPDTVGAVGATQYVQVVNVGLAVFDKATKSVIYG